MPELPEVESYRLALEAELLSHRVNAVRILTRFVVAFPADPVAGIVRSRTDAPPARARFALLLKGDTVTSILRHGKQLAIIGRSGAAVAIHLGMTGRFSLDAAPATHVHVTWHLDDGRTLRFIDPRRFGLVAGHESFDDLRTKRWSRLGPDALAITPKLLAVACAGSARPIKSLLLDQSRVAGIGNIYADEALFAARVHPLEPAHNLAPDTLELLALQLRAILTAAIDAGGSTIRDHRMLVGTAGSYQNHHRVYARAGQPCNTCHQLLVGLRVSGRATVFCRSCQLHHEK